MVGVYNGVNDMHPALVVTIMLFVFPFMYHAPEFVAGVIIIGGGLMILIDLFKSMKKD